VEGVAACNLYRVGCHIVFKVPCSVWRTVMLSGDHIDENITAVCGCLQVKSRASWSAVDAKSAALPTLPNLEPEATSTLNFPLVSQWQYVPRLATLRVHCWD
jgi:hypothetical protein